MESNYKPAGQRLLVVDDDPDVRDSLGRALRRAGYSVHTAANGAEALDSVARSPVDLIVLDVLMPMVDGFDACRRFRERGDATPILLLTARDAIDDRVTGLEVGADDYLVKPFALRELLARLRALLRRSQPPRVVLGYADLVLDTATRRVTRGGAVITLTKMEFSLLELLLRNAEQVLSYELILDRVWGYGEAPASNALQVFVAFLRRKLEHGGRQRLLHNVRGVGYVMRVAP
jgi:two-component system response regulator MprA